MVDKVENLAKGAFRDTKIYLVTINIRFLTLRVMHIVV